jgi:hypothetical protein
MMIMISLFVFKKIAQQPLISLWSKRKKKKQGLSLEWHIRGNYLEGLRFFTNRRALSGVTQLK